MIEVLLSPWILFIFFAVIIVILRHRQNLKIWQSSLIPAFIALLAFQRLYLRNGKVSLLADDAPLLDHILVAIVIIFGSHAILQFMQRIIIKLIAKRQYIRTPPYLINLFGWSVSLFITILVLQEVLGLELTGLLVGSAVLTATIGFSLRDLLGGFFSGIILQFEAPFIVGDWIEVGGQEGKLVQLNLRTLAILTRMGNYIILPNNEVSSKKISNFSRPISHQAIKATIDIPILHSPAIAKQLLLRSISNIEGILPDPAPQVLVMGYSNASVQYDIQYWIDDYERKPIIQDEVYSRFWYSLHRAGLLVDANISDQETTALIKKKQKGQIEIILRSLSFLEMLNEDQIRRLAGAGELQRYTSGEELVCQGDEGDSLFVIESGIAGIFIKTDNDPLRVDERIEGDFFGEMSLLTGELRSATVIAETEMNVVMIDRKHFTDVLITDPVILSLLLDASDKRRSNLETKRAMHDEQSRKQGTARSILIQKISRFLGIPLPGANSVEQ